MIVAILSEFFYPARLMVRETHWNASRRTEVYPLVGGQWSDQPCKVRRWRSEEGIRLGLLLNQVWARIELDDPNLPCIWDVQYEPENLDDYDEWDPMAQRMIPMLPSRIGEGRRWVRFFYRREHRRCIQSLEDMNAENERG